MVTLALKLFDRNLYTYDWKGARSALGRMICPLDTLKLSMWRVEWRFGVEIFLRVFACVYLRVYYTGERRSVNSLIRG